MMDYPLLKSIHIGTVMLSIGGFSVRGMLMLANSPLIWNRAVRTFPHIIDTLLLVSGLWMAFLINQYPGTSAWLTAKLVALVLYIGLGFIALRLGKTRGIRVAAFLGALLCFVYMALVAVHKSPFPVA